MNRRGGSRFFASALTRMMKRKGRIQEPGDGRREKAEGENRKIGKAGKRESGRAERRGKAKGENSEEEMRKPGSGGGGVGGEIGSWFSGF